MSSQTLKFKTALIGCGRIGEKHAKLLKNALSSDVDFYSTVDKNDNKATDFAEKFNTTSYHSVEELLDSQVPDLAIVATETGDHFSTASKLLDASVNVVIEKPIALRLNDARDLIELAKKKNVKLYVVKQNRFNPPIQFAYNKYKEGMIGNPHLGVVRVFWKRDRSYYLQDQWRGTWKQDGGVLLNQAIHHLDIMQYFLGEVATVQGTAANFENPREAFDTVCALIKFRSGAIGIVEACVAVFPGDIGASFTLIGSKGNFSIGGASLNKLESFNSNSNSELNVDKFSSSPPDVYGFGHQNFLYEVVKDLRGESSEAVSGEEGTKSLKIASAILRSIELNKTIDFSSDLDTESQWLGKR